MLMEQFTFALKSGDANAIAEMRQAIGSYNSTVPDAMLRITAKDLSASVKGRYRRAVEEEANLPSSKKEAGLYKQIEERFR
jgi:hypothetical protein